VENYFNYFTEIEERFQRRRGRIQLCPLDWALIETWKDAGIPLEAVLRGVDAAFDKYEQRPSKSQKVNSLAYCAQAVLVAAEEMKEAAVGTAAQPPDKSGAVQGFEPDAIAAFLRRAGWLVNDKRVERIWRREGLKVPARQPKRARLWLSDGSCIRLRAERPNHVWSYDFVEERTHDGKRCCEGTFRQRVRSVSVPILVWDWRSACV